MRSVMLIVTISVFDVVSAGWNHFHGHIQHHHGPPHFDRHQEYDHFGNHDSHHGPHNFTPHQESSYFGPPYEHHHYAPPYRPPYIDSNHESPQFKPPQESPYFRPPTATVPPYGGPPHHFRPPWNRHDYDKHGLETDDSDDDSSSYNSSEEDNHNGPDPSRTTRKVEPQLAIQTTVPTSTETTTRLFPNKPSSYRTTYSPSFSTLDIHFGTPTHPSTANNSPVQDCLISCKTTMTPEYNPVCGTNNVIYQNIGLLLCTKGCGVDVEVSHTFSCPRNSFRLGFRGATQTTRPTEPTTNRQTTESVTSVASARTTLSARILNCMQTCPFDGAFRPVCGTDHVTYFNYDRLMCAKKCGIEVELHCSFACPTSNCYALKTTSTTPTTTTSGWNGAGTSPMPPSPQLCLSTCSVTTEYKPVCGTNNITYGNPSKLQCAQQCGVDVRLQHESMCAHIGVGDTTSSSRPTAAPAASTMPPFTDACMRACIVTPEYNPVCGTNNVTYTNPGRLRCAQMCGADVEIRSNSPCTITNKNDFTPVTDSPTGNEVSKPPSPTTEGSTREGSTTKGSTIDFSVLDIIFGRPATTTQMLPTTESDEVFEIDPRFNNL